MTDRSLHSLLFTPATKVSLRAGLLGCFVAFVLLIFVLIIVSEYVVSTQRTYGLCTNLAGRQRMLTERMAKETLLLSLAESEEARTALRTSLGHTVSLFDQTLYALRDGGEVIDAQSRLRVIPGATDTTTREHLDKAIAFWASVKPAVAALVEGAIDPASPKAEETVRSTARQAATLVDLVNDVTVAFEKDHERRSSSLATFQLLAGGSAALLLVLVVWTLQTRVFPVLRGRDQMLRKFQKTLHDLEERFRPFVGITKDAIVAVDNNGRIIIFNPAAEQMFGYSKEEMIGSPVDPLVPEEYRERHRESLRECFSTLGVAGPTAKTVEVPGLRRDGDLFPAEVSLSFGEHAEQRFVVAVIRDVTQRKQAEEERSRLEQQLRLAQKMEAVGQLASGVAHDFNNLLMVINGYSGLLLRGMEKDDPRRAEIEEINKAGERAATLTRQLLAFSRRQILQPRILNVNRVVTDMEKMLRRVIGEHIELLCVPDPNLGRVKVDPAQIEQVIINLAVNARDAMPDGGKLTIETANVEIGEEYVQRHVAVTPGSYAMLAVTDTGIGMDEETQSRIFEPFFTTKERGEGTGLGLATVYGIVKQSGGYIWVYSEPGQGTTFKIYFPRIEGEEEPLQINETDESLRGTETILVVEDDEAVRDLLRKTLERSGYTVLAASGADEAVRLCLKRGGRVDLMITDVILPDIRGHDLARRVGELCGGIKVLYMSGYTDNVIVRHGLLRPGVDFLQKPVSPQTLLRKVRQILSRRNH